MSGGAGGATVRHEPFVLDADQRSPSLARRYVSHVLASAGLDDLVDDALLLTSELVTNAVVHAGTTLAVSIATGDAGATIGVCDRGGTPVGLPSGPDRYAEGGRGLMLVHRLARTWGTTHDDQGTMVWFGLGRIPPSPPRPVLKPSTGTPDAGPLVEPATAAASQPGARAPGAPPGPAGPPRGLAPALAWLAALGDDLLARLSPAEVQGEVLARLVDVLGADAAVLWVAADDGTPSVAATAGLDSAGTALVDAALVPGRPHGAARVYRGRPQVVAARTLLGAVGMACVAAVPLPALAGVGGLEVAFRSPDDAFAGPAHDVDELLGVARLAAERLGLLLRADRLNEAERRRRGELSFLAEASELLGGSLDARLTVALLPTLVVPRLGDWAAVLLPDDEGGLRVETVGHVDEDAVGALRERLAGPPGRRLERVWARMREVADPGPEPGDANEVLVPLVARRRMLGLLVLGRLDGRLPGPAEMALAEEVARRSALALDNARLYGEQRRLARALQAALLPRALPVGGPFEFGAQYDAAGEGTVGGDFYDVLPLDPESGPAGGYGLLIGDVQGKGPEAAAVTGMARDAARLLLREGRSPADVLAALNATLIEHDTPRFCTAVVGHVRPGRLLLCVAGHPLPVLVPAGQHPRLVGRPGTLLGVLEEVDLVEVEVPFSSGDLLVLYTDGLVERRDGSRMFGEGGLLAAASDAAGLSAPAAAVQLRQAATDFGPGEVRDDLAVLVVRHC